MSSKRTKRPVDLASIVNAAIDPLLAGGRELLAFTDAAILRDHDEIAIARTALQHCVGDVGVVRAAACSGNFEMMNRLLDAIGVRVSTGALGLAAELHLDVPQHLHPL